LQIKGQIKGQTFYLFFAKSLGFCCGIGQSGLDGREPGDRLPGVEAGATLAIETSTPRASVALVTADGAIEQRFFQSDRSHNAVLFGPLRELLVAVEKSGERVGRILVGSGPGSYSGTRVGIAAAQGVAMAVSAPVAAVPSVLALDGSAGLRGLMVIGDARRGTWWVARVASRRLMESPVLLDAEQLRAVVREAVDSGWELASMESSVYPLDPSLCKAIRRVDPSAAGLWMAWAAADEAQRQAWTADPPRPMYLKPPHITSAHRV